MTATVREARPEDLPRLLAIQEASLAEPWPALLRAGVEGPPLVLVAGHEPAGYALAVVGDEAAYLAEIAVTPDARGEGYGSMLMDALVARLRGTVEAIRLTVRAADGRARSFYAAHGFEAVERLDDHYERGDGLLMARPLTDRRS